MVNIPISIDKEVCYQSYCSRKVLQIEETWIGLSRVKKSLEYKTEELEARNSKGSNLR